jgi:hypothetical protein
MTDFMCDSIDGRVWSGRPRPLPLVLELMLIFVLILIPQTPKTNVKGSGQECQLYTKSTCEKLVEMRQ